jgi:nitroreductase
MNPDEVLDLMKNRRSTRDFQDKPIPDEIIQKVLIGAQWCQSANNAQPWRLIVIKNKEIIKKISDICSYGHFIKKAPIAIAIVGDKKQSPKWYIYDNSMLSHQICLLAWAYGIGTCWIGSMDRDKVGTVLKIQKTEEIITVLPLGYPVNIGSSTRKALDEIVSTLE